MSQESQTAGHTGAPHTGATHTGTIQPLAAGPDGRLTAPAAARNLAPILAVLRRLLPETGRAVELASGTGQHIAAFAEAFPGIHWTPTDVERERLASIAAWRAAGGCANLEPPALLNVADPVWPFAAESADLVLTVNLLHLIPAPAAEALFTGAARLLRQGGLCIIYGPFMRNDAFVSEGDRSFHESLRRMDPAIGYKSREWVTARALAAGLDPVEWVEMPANNLMLVARKQPTSPE
jgi:SAM-dependent methyltransferase